MRYVYRVQNAWQHTLDVAIAKNASTLQLQAIEDLRETEFGWGSNMRLREMWKTFIDEDGDIELRFYDINISGIRTLVTVNIDRDGVLTTKDHITLETEMWDPVTGGWTDNNGVHHRMWMLESRFFKNLVMPSIQIVCWATPFGLTHGAVVADDPSNHTYSPMFFYDTGFQGITTTSYWDGAIAGMCRVHGKLAYFEQIYEDDVSRERIYSVHKVSGWKALKVHLSRLSLWAQLRFNKLHWKLFGRHTAYHFPMIKYSKLGTTESMFGYTMLRRLVGVTG